MNLNFLTNDCRENARTDISFGLCDAQDGNIAYSDTLHQATWIATVRNNMATSITFTPVDKCIIKDNEYPGRGRCDGILTSQDHLYFVELKDQARGWLNQAIEQLESTIDFFKANHEINNFRHKKAFACNRQHGHFYEIDNEVNLRFFQKHGVRLDIQAEILIIS